MVDRIIKKRISLILIMITVMKVTVMLIIIVFVYADDSEIVDKSLSFINFNNSLIY